MNYLHLLNTAGYFPHAGQVRFHESDKRFKVLIAGARFGKSLAAGNDVVRDLLCSQCRGWLVAPTYSLAVPEFRYLIETAAKLGIHTSRVQAAKGEPLGALFENGAEVDCLSARIPETMLGREVDWMILCEASRIDRDTFERFLRARLTTREGRLIVPTTPNGHNWILELYQRGIDAKDGWESFRFASWDNPHLSGQEVEAARSELPPPVFDEQYGGAFVARAGRVYADFERALHAIAPAPIPSGVRVLRGIDFGFTNPFVCIWAYLDQDERMVVFDEYVRAGATLYEHAQEILRRDSELRRQGAVVGECAADPSGRSDREELARLGLPNSAADNALLAGINVVRQRLRKRADGSRGLLISATCANLIREFEGYCFEDQAGLAEPLPVKANDHCLDALRYLCVTANRHVDWRAANAL